MEININDINVPIVVDNLLFDLKNKLDNRVRMTGFWFSLKYKDKKLGIIYIRFSIRCFYDTKSNTTMHYHCIDIGNIMIFKKYQKLGIFKEIIKQLSNNIIFHTNSIYIEKVLNINLQKYLDRENIIKIDDTIEPCYLILNNKT